MAITSIWLNWSTAYVPLSAGVAVPAILSPPASSREACCAVVSGGFWIAATCAAVATVHNGFGRGKV